MIRFPVPSGDSEPLLLGDYVFDLRALNPDRNQLVHPAPGGSSEAIISQYETWAKETLRSCGLPDELGVYERKGEEWVRVQPDDIGLKDRRTESGVDRRTLVTLDWVVRERRLSAEWFAAQVLSCAKRAREALANADPEKVAVNVAHLVHYAKSGLVVERTARDAVRGEKHDRASRQGFEEGRNARVADRKKVHDQWRQEAKNIRDKSPDLSKRSIAAVIARKHCVNLETVRKRI